MSSILKWHCYLFLSAVATDAEQWSIVPIVASAVSGSQKQCLRCSFSTESPKTADCQKLGKCTGKKNHSVLAQLIKLLQPAFSAGCYQEQGAGISGTSMYCSPYAHPLTIPWSTLIVKVHLFQWQYWWCPFYCFLNTALRLWHFAFPCHCTFQIVLRSLK